MGMRFRMFCVLTAFLCVLGAGCTQTGEAEQGGGEVYAGEIEEFTVLVLGGVSHDLTDMDDLVGQELSRRTGVRLRFSFPVGDWNEELTLLIAGGEYPDLIINKDNAIEELVKAGALVGLRDKIENAPNLKAYLGDLSKRLVYSADDPEYYCFGSNAVVSEPSPGEYWAVAFALQMDVLQKAGWPVVRTPDEFESLIAAYKEANPEINGLPSIGLSLIAADNWRWKISVTNPAFLAGGKPDDGEWIIDPDSYEATLHYKDPGEKEYFRWLNHLHDIGLLDPESFTQSYDTYQAKIAGGRVIGLIDALWQYDIARKEAMEAGGAARNYIPFPVLQDPDNMVWSQGRDEGHVQIGGYMVTKACKNVDKIVSFFDYLATEEAQILKAWGIEGVHYDIVDGLRVTKPEVKTLVDQDFIAYRKASGIGRYSDPIHNQPGYGWKTSNGQMLTEYTEEEIWDSLSPIEEEAMNAYGVRSFVELFPSSGAVPPSPYGAAWTLLTGQTAETKAVRDALEGLTLASIAKAVLASPEDFDAAWDEFMQKIEDINIGLLENEVSALVKERLRLWS